MQTAVVDDSTGLIVVDVRVAFQLIEAEAVDIQLTELRVVGDNEEVDGSLGEVLNFEELLDAVVPAKAFTVFHYLTGKEGTDTGHFAQLGSVGTVQDDALFGLQLDGIFDGVALLDGFIFVEIIFGGLVFLADAYIGF